MTSIGALSRVNPAATVDTRTTPKPAVEPAVATPTPTPTANYTSPVYTFDTLTGAAIFDYRNGTTGAEIYQTPSRATLLYRNNQKLTSATEKTPSTPVNE